MLLLFVCLRYCSLCLFVLLCLIWPSFLLLWSFFVSFIYFRTVSVPGFVLGTGIGIGLGIGIGIASGLGFIPVLVPVPALPVLVLVLNFPVQIDQDLDLCFGVVLELVLVISGVVAETIFVGRHVAYSH